MSNNGPTFTKATYKASRNELASSPERRRAAEAEAMRDAAWGRRFRTLLNSKDKDAWYDEYFAKKDE